MSLGIGGSLLAAIFVTEALVHGGFFVPYSVGVFVMVGLCARLFGKVKLSVYCVVTLAFTSLLFLVGIP